VSYRVETSTRHFPDTFHQDGPTCLHLSAAFEMVEALKGDHMIRCLRIRDMSRNAAKRDPIIFYMDKGKFAPLEVIQ
jgi:hypothetical protein